MIQFRLKKFESHSLSNPTFSLNTKEFSAYILLQTSITTCFILCTERLNIDQSENKISSM